MLAKDYRMRCDLDAVVEDDWVTFEGSEPLFEEDDSFGVNFSDFSGGGITTADGKPVLKALIIDSSISKRKMLLQQLNSIRHVMCACSPNNDAALDIVHAAMTNSPEANFDLIFCELVLAPAEGYDTVQRIRDAGFKGRIMGLLRNSDNMDLFLDHGAHSILRRPIATRELSRLFAEVDLINSTSARGGFVRSMSSKLAGMTIANGTSNNKFSPEEVEAAITTTAVTMRRAESSLSMRSSYGQIEDSDEEGEGRRGAGAAKKPVPTGAKSPQVRRFCSSHR